MINFFFPIRVVTFLVLSILDKWDAFAMGKVVVAVEADPPVPVVDPLSENKARLEDTIAVVTLEVVMGVGRFEGRGSRQREEVIELVGHST